MTVHGDDFTVSAPVEDLTWLHIELAKVWSVKQQILELGEGVQRQVRILNRLLTWTENGIEYEADQRHADITNKQMGLTASKLVVTPAVNDSAQQLKARSSEAALPREDTAAYRGCRHGQTSLLKIVLISSLQRQVQPSASVTQGRRIGCNSREWSDTLWENHVWCRCSLGKTSQVLLMDSATVIGQEIAEIANPQVEACCRLECTP